MDPTSTLLVGDSRLCSGGVEEDDLPFLLIKTMVGTIFWNKANINFCLLWLDPHCLDLWLRK